MALLSMQDAQSSQLVHRPPVVPLLISEESIIHKLLSKPGTSTWSTLGSVTLPLRQVHDGTLEAFRTHRLNEEAVSPTTLKRTLEVVRKILNASARSYRDDSGQIWLETAPLLTMPVLSLRKPYALSWGKRGKGSGLYLLADSARMNVGTQQNSEPIRVTANHRKSKACCGTRKYRPDPRDC